MQQDGLKRSVLAKSVGKPTGTGTAEGTCTRQTRARGQPSSSEEAKRVFWSIEGVSVVTVEPVR